MEMVVPGLVLWELFVIICPVFKEALPRNVDRRNLDPGANNYITDICSSIESILLAISSGNLDNTKLDNSNISESLYSLLEVFENMISVSFGKGHTIQRSDFSVSQDQSAVGLTYTWS